MSHWREKPTIIDHWPKDIDYVMAIDENGTTDLNGINKLVSKEEMTLFNACRDSNMFIDERWFTVTGLIMHRSNFGKYREDINTVKYSHWDNGIYQYNQGSRRVVFHSREIRKRIGPFNPKIIDYPILINDISTLIMESEFNVISSSIDKVKHIAKYTTPHHVYNLNLTFIIERFCITLSRQGKRGILLLESRGKKEDTEILQFITNLIRNGNRYYNSDHFNCIDGIYFNPKWCFNLNKGQASFVLLELADLVSYPIFKFARSNIEDLAFKSVESKIEGFPNYNGYGIKIFP